MMSKKRTTTKTAVETKTLTPVEEKVVRMRHGLTAPGDLVLERVGQEHPETAAMLAEMEQRALQAVAARNNPTKRKIVNALKRTK